VMAHVKVTGSQPAASRFDSRGGAALLRARLG
jgi:hypothetical protein